MRSGEFDGAFGGLGAGGEQKDFVQSRRSHARQALGESSAFFAGKAVIVEQAAVHLIEDGLAYLGCGVAGVGDQDPAGKVEPAVAVLVINRNVFGAVPDEDRLAVHGLRFELAKLLKRRQRVGCGSGVAIRRYFVSTRATSRGTMLNSLPITPS